MTHQTRIAAHSIPAIPLPLPVVEKTGLNPARAERRPVERGRAVDEQAIDNDPHQQRSNEQYRDDGWRRPHLQPVRSTKKRGPRALQAPGADGGAGRRLGWFRGRLLALAIVGLIGIDPFIRAHDASLSWRKSR